MLQTKELLGASYVAGWWGEEIKSCGQRTYSGRIWIFWFRYQSTTTSKEFTNKHHWYNLQFLWFNYISTTNDDECKDFLIQNILVIFKGKRKEVFERVSECWRVKSHPLSTDNGNRGAAEIEWLERGYTCYSSVIHHIYIQTSVTSLVFSHDHNCTILYTQMTFSTEDSEKTFKLGLGFGWIAWDRILKPQITVQIMEYEPNIHNCSEDKDFWHSNISEPSDYHYKVWQYHSVSVWTNFIIRLNITAKRR